MSDWDVPRMGGSVTHATTEGVRQALLQSPVFAYPSFQPVEATPVVNVVGAVASVAETSVSLAQFVKIPPNTAGIQYRIAVNSTATAAGTTFELRHMPGGGAALIVEAQVVGLANYASGTIAVNSGRVTYAATKGASTAFTYVVWVTGFFRAY